MFRDQHELLARRSGSTAGLLETLTEAPLERIRTAVLTLFRAGYLGSPWFALLVLSGLVVTKWWRERGPQGLALLVLPGVTLAVLLAVQWNWTRYYFPLLPMGMIWLAAGCTTITRWIVGRLRARDPAGALLSGSVILGIALQSLRSLNPVGEIRQTRDGGAREAGYRIAADHRGQPGATERPLIATVRLAIAHYAGGEVAYLPEADESRALVYLRRLAPDYVAIKEVDFRDSTSYENGWVKGGLPDRCAITLNGSQDTGYRIWRWTCQPGDQPPS
jgi:hypothetical protein